ncbi:MAG: radical SAM protein [Candidatus Omnitrophica bacterium]|nr:radical SAM protein [Candidatus Omnitrophota bacterium]
MIPIYRMPVIHIEITNACNITCSNCTRFVGHHDKVFFMELDFVEKAIDSLEGFPGFIGIMGGEPTAHPRFVEICKIVQQKIPRPKRQLWTNGFKWDKHRAVISETFDDHNITFNSHKDPEVGTHQPLLLAAEDILEDRELMWRLIGNCWIQWRWAASITPKGGFFCEVAAAQDMLFDGPGGYPLEKGWWNKNPNEFADQVKKHCTKCSAAIPMPGISSHADYDLISKTNEKRLKDVNSPRLAKGKFRVVDIKLTEEDIERAVKAGWTPWSHRPYKQNSPEHKWVETIVEGKSIPIPETKSSSCKSCG